MKILIIGSCRNDDDESRVFEDKLIAEELGIELAKRGHEIITGGAGGLQGILVNSYKKSGGKKWISILASGEDDDANAHPLGNIIADEKIKTKYNYAMRDVYYIGKVDAVIALSGKLLTFAEIIHAVKNYDKLVFQLEMGENVSKIKNSPELNDNVIISSEVLRGLEFIEKN